jgi:methylthioribose-1-phosphate isomerase
LPYAITIAEADDLTVDAVPASRRPIAIEYINASTARNYREIEERDPVEIYQIGQTLICPAGTEFYNPAFDVTPAELITAIITEHGAVQPADLIQLKAKQLG